MLGFFYGPTNMATKKSATTEQLFSIARMPFVRADKTGGFIIDIQVMPNANRTQGDGLHGEDDRPSLIALKLRLKAPPVDGKANDALIKWLASQLGVARNTLELVRGQTSRRKQIWLSADTAESANWQQLADQRQHQPERGAI
ncbi:MAG: DUF167 domain-containing protein [Pseudomonadota bacterium]